MADYLLPHDAALARLKTLHPVLIDLSLDRVLRLLDALGRPQDHLPPVIHVAGTNGKGSTTAMIRAIAEAAGLSVHVLTSPHLVCFVERIRLAGTLIGEEVLADILARVEAANAGQPITFFEIVTAAALLAFAETPSDLCLIEVGLGGRFDATNVVDHPAVSVICPVDFDHQDFLGDTLAAIAGEKAGIIKAGVPAVTAHQAVEAFAVIEAQARRLRAPLIAAGQAFDAWSEGGRLLWQQADTLLDLPLPNLAGRHQVDNAGVAIAAALALGDARIDQASIGRGLSAIDWPARMQRLTLGPLGEAATARGADLWLDGGHNPHGARAVADWLANLMARDGRPATVILGMLQRKDAGGVLRALKPLCVRLILTGFSAEAAASPDALAEAARAEGFAPQTAAGPQSALTLALSAPGPAPHILICGSLYLAGEVLALDPQTWPK